MRVAWFLAPHRNCQSCRERPAGSRLPLFGVRGEEMKMVVRVEGPKAIALFTGEQLHWVLVSNGDDEQQVGGGGGGIIFPKGPLQLGRDAPSLLIQQGVTVTDSGWGVFLRIS